LSVDLPSTSEVAVRLDLVLEVRVEARDDVELARERAVEGGLRVGDVVEDDLLDLRLVAPVGVVAVEVIESPCFQSARAYGPVPFAFVLRSVVSPS
jgi:hypothetical protein